MDFDFTDDQTSLRDAVAKWVEKGFDFSRRHQLAKDGGKTRAVYTELAELGLTAVAIPEEHGGMGFGPVEAMVVMEEMGRGLVNAPLAAGALVSPALLSAGSSDLQAEWLPKIAAGEALVVPAQQERRSRYDLNKVATQGAKAGDGWTLSGHKTVVPAADEADAFIVSARISGAEDATDGIGLFLVTKDAKGVTVQGYPTQDGARAGELQLDNAEATLITDDGYETLQKAWDIGTAAVCAEGVGAMDQMLAITLDYLNTRQQFGVALSTFQVLRHRAADCKMALELGRSMSYYATLKLSEPAEQRRRSISQAKAQLGQSVRFVGQACTQMHGGIGVTDEYISSHYFKRLTMIEMAYGDTNHHLDQVAGRMQDTAGVFA